MAGRTSVTKEEAVELAHALCDKYGGRVCVLRRAVWINRSGCWFFVWNPGLVNRDTVNLFEEWVAKGLERLI